MDYKKISQGIADNIGGKENVISVVHCMTRLRFKLKDTAKADTDKIKSIGGIINVLESGGQYQVVIGTQVSELYPVMLETLGISIDAKTENAAEDEPQGLFNKFIDVVAGIFTPVIGVMMATGLLKGLTILMAALGVLEKGSGTYRILYATGDAFLYFMPLFLGFSAAKKFGMKPYIGMAIGAALVYPDIVGMVTEKPLYKIFAGSIFESNIMATFAGIPLMIMRYTSSVIPVILATFFASRLEKVLMKTIPGMLRNIAVPTFTLLITVPLTFLLIGPVSIWLGNMISTATMGLYGINPVLAGALIGGSWQVLVLFGLHWSFVPVMINNIATLGYDSVAIMGNALPFATAGAVLAVIIKTRNSQLRTIAWPAFISALFGITEPALYGVTLPRKKPFYATIAANAVAGALFGLFMVRRFNLGANGIFGIPNYINVETGIDSTFYYYLLSIGAAAVCGFVFAYVLGFVDETASEGSSKLEKDETLLSPLSGQVRSLNEVEDPAFAEGIMGKGLAIVPDKGEIVAPVDGTVTTLFPTLHALGFTTDGGAEVLIHVGLNTVELNGRHFKAHIKQGDHVKKGDILIEFDQSAIEKEGYSTVTPVIVTNYMNYSQIAETDSKQVNALENLLVLEHA